MEPEKFLQMYRNHVSRRILFIIGCFVLSLFVIVLNVSI